MFKRKNRLIHHMEAIQRMLLKNMFLQKTNILAGPRKRRMGGRAGVVRGQGFCLVDDYEVVGCNTLHQSVLNKTSNKLNLFKSSFTKSI